MSQQLTEATGYKHRRGLQYRDGEDAPDSFCDELPFHWECKRYKTKAPLRPAFKQADAASGNRTPIVVAKEDNEPAMVYMRFEDFLAIFGTRFNVTNG